MRRLDERADIREQLADVASDEDEFWLEFFYTDFFEDLDWDNCFDHDDFLRMPEHMVSWPIRLKLEGHISEWSLSHSFG